MNDAKEKKGERGGERVGKSEKREGGEREGEEGGRGWKEEGRRDGERKEEV